MINTTFDINDSLSKEINIKFAMKNKPFVIIMEYRIRKESWALVYLIIPAYVFILKNTTELIMANSSMFLLNSGRFIKLMLKLNRIKYAKDKDITQQLKSSENIIQRGTMFI